MSGLFDGLPEIPIYTAILLGVSEWMQSYQWLLALALIFSCAGIVYSFKSSKWRNAADGNNFKNTIFKKLSAYC